ncbi:MAG TPA: hypothetical protein VNO43_13295 [Candidatus Eisenbacteria bacterium]|nr:hypothetical protein [Candidatus Eisenbacteria bacterium]
MNGRKSSPSSTRRHSRFTSTTATLLLCFSSACTSTFEPGRTVESKPPPDSFARAKTLAVEGNFEAAYLENQKILSERKGAPDLALFNMGMLSATSLNPRRNHARALASFRKLVDEHPESPYAEQAKAWIQVLEEHQKVVDEKQKIAEEKQRLIEEKRALIREREVLTQEKERLKYTAERSRQIDIEVEKRRREALRRAAPATSR